MTVRELIERLNELGEDNLDRKIIMFDGPNHFTPYKVEILGEKWNKHIQGCVLID